ncbi:hypothetical protein SAMN05421505_14726 [Sinosporangium album]|uniref:Uncharacterized protein n=1 Tax=Sinosporangium album TaxID=504805 RepID=A0A1G8K4C6_9ACTN|nr:transcriptional regulator [Sinosporangium album]SDI38278.1 hypothetical protein SAMN05421505_14726 [Sinosporangium album]
MTATDFGSPPRADENRSLIEQRVREALGTSEVRESLTIEWRGRPRYVEVIDMPVDALYYNPATHRIRAQRSFDPQREAELNADPWSDTSQEYLALLLKSLPADPAKEDPTFEDLKNSLRDFKQNEPGLITRDGTLVNGNTRCVALRELGVRSIRVGVLPESCTWEDVNAIELSLQLRREHKRDYSYINHLLALDEQLASGRPIADIAREFRIQSKTVERDKWILTALRDLVERSKSGDSQLKLMDFENSKEKLAELHRKYMDIASENKDQADLVKENRLAAIVLGFSKTDIRHIEVDFQLRYLAKVLPDNLKPSATQTPTSIPGLGRSVRSAGTDVAEAKAFTDILLKAKAVTKSNENSNFAEADAQTHEAETVLGDAQKAIDSALTPAGRDARIRKKRQAAPDRLNDACLDLEQSITDLVHARSSRTLDEDAFDEALIRLRGILDKLAIESARSIKTPGEGVTWLLDAVGREK